MAYYLGPEEDAAFIRIKKNIEYKKYCQQLKNYEALLLEHIDDPYWEIPDCPTPYEKVELTREEEYNLFNKIILPAIQKLVDSLIFKYSLISDPNLRDFKDDCIGHLISKIEFYEFDKGSAFNFFNVVCRNHILQYIEKKKKNSPIISTSRKDSDSNGSDENSIASSTLSSQFIDNEYLHAGEPENDTFYRFLLKEVAKIIVNCTDKKEKEFLKHVLHILETTPLAEDDVTIRNKKMFYLSMRNLSNLRPRDITKYLSKLKVYKKEIYKKYTSL